MPLPLAPQPPPPVSLSRAWLAASDPAGLRARRGAQAALAAVLTGLALWAISKLLGPPVRSMSAGVILAVFGVVMVREAGRGQHLTTAVLFLASCLAATVAAALLPWWRLQAGAFLVVIFAAVYARRFGPRWAATGMAAYVAYLAVCYLRTPLELVPNQWLGLAVGASMAELWRALLLRERPGQVLASAAHAVELEVGLVLAEAARALRRGGWTPRRRRRLLRSQNVLAQHLVLIEQQLPALAPDEDELVHRFRLRLLELESAALRLSRLALHGTNLPPRAATIAAELASAFLSGRQRRAPAADAQAGDAFALAARRLAGVPPLGPAASDLAARAPREPGAAPPAAGGAPGRPLRQAVQTTTACGLATFAGFLLSPQRWLWAVIAAYVVFAGVRSSGHVLVKSLQRTAGTVAGVLVGVGLATLVSGHNAVAVPLLAVFVFLTFYSFQASYTAMIFWLTLALALLYGLLGFFKPQLLVLRLEETLIGSAAGVLVAHAVFRTRTEDAVWSACGDFMDKLRALVAASAARPDVAAGRLRRVRDLTLAFQGVRDVTRPNAGAFGPPSGAGSTAVLEALASCRYFAGELALASLREPPTAALAAAAHEVDAQIVRCACRLAPDAGTTAGRLDGERAEPDALGALRSLSGALGALDPGPGQVEKR